MKNQKGYINLDGLFAGLIFFGVVVGVVAAFVIPWIWSLIKPAIHALTAG